MEVKFKKLHVNSVVPSYAKEGDAGLDFVALDDGTFNKKEDRSSYWEYRTGIAIELPEGYVGLVFPRSSVSNKSLDLANSVGVVDSGYRGEILFRFRDLGGNRGKYKAGDKIGQMIIMPYPKVTPVVVQELSTTDRGEGGYGSTGA